MHYTMSWWTLFLEILLDVKQQQVSLSTVGQFHEGLYIYIYIYIYIHNILYDDLYITGSQNRVWRLVCDTGRQMTNCSPAEMLLRHVCNHLLQCTDWYGQHYEYDTNRHWILPGMCQNRQSSSRWNVLHGQPAVHLQAGFSR